MAGIAGEQQVAAELGGALGDDWTLLHGYRKQRSEIRRLIQHDHALHDKQRHDKHRRAGSRPPR